MDYLVSLSRPTLSAIGRLAGFAIMLGISLHIFACIWVCMGRAPNSWVTVKVSYLSDTNDSTLYLAAFYWGSTVFATVGYGDITGNTADDYLFTMVIFVRFAETMD